MFKLMDKWSKEYTSEGWSQDAQLCLCLLASKRTSNTVSKSEFRVSRRLLRMIDHSYPYFTRMVVNDNHNCDDDSSLGPTDPSDS